MPALRSLTPRRVSCLRVLRLGCNLVASKNCGNWSLCHPSLVADPFSRQVFLDKIRLSLTGRYQDNIDDFLQSGSYADLLETILAF